MNATVKYLLIAGALVGAYFLITKKMKGTVVASSAANQGASNADGMPMNKDTVNAAGTGQNTCKPPREVIQGSCILRETKPPVKSMIAQSKVSANKPSIVQRGFIY